MSELKLVIVYTKELLYLPRVRRQRGRERTERKGRCVCVYRQDIDSVTCVSYKAARRTEAEKEVLLL